MRIKRLPVIFRLDKEIFYLFCLLNLLDYDGENNSAGMHKLRSFIRDDLRKNIKDYQSLANFFKQKHQGQFVEWVLWKKYAKEDLINRFSKKDLQFFKKFNKDFKLFIKNEKKRIPWSTARTLYLREKKLHFSQIVNQLNKIMDDIQINFRDLGLNNIIIIPNFLDRYNWGYGPKIKKSAIIVYGPLYKKDFRLIRHEFLHSVIKSLIFNNKIFIKKINDITKHRKIPKELKRIGYSEWPEIIEEHLVRALEIKTRPTKTGSKKEALSQEKKKGFKYIEMIYDKLSYNKKSNNVLILNQILDKVIRIVT
jgi:hypothetical protein